MLPASTRCEHASHGIEHAVEIGVDALDPVKVSLVTLTNRSDRPRHLSLYAFAEWRLGPPRSSDHLQVQTSFDADRSAVLAINPFNQAFAGRTAFLARERTARLGHRKPSRVSRAQWITGHRRRPDPAHALG